MKRTKKWWIKRRDNPQIGTYYVPEGQLSKTEARRHERPLYGSNTMLGFDNESAYLAKIDQLKNAGEKLQ